MRHLILFALWLGLFVPSVLAQRPGGPPGGARSAPGVEVTGMVIDSVTGDAIPYATVQLLMARQDSILNGALTNEKGRFAVADVAPGRYRLRVVGLELRPTDVPNVEVCLLYTSPSPRDS